LGAWPETDRLAWSRAIADGDIFGRGPAAHWAQTTRNAVIAAYGRWLSFLAASEPQALILPPSERLTKDLLTRYLAHLAETAGTVGQHMFFAKLRDAVRVMFSNQIPPHLSRVVARLERECQPRSKAERVVNTTRLTALGIDLMKRAIGSDGQVVDHVAYRDGLMVALLSRRPIRRRTFTLIQIDTHLRRTGEEWRMVFEGPDTKSGRPLGQTVPQRLVPFVERYLREVRPRFLGANRHEGLWAGTKGTPLKGQAIYGIVAARTRAAFGHPIGPHLFRHCAATTIAIVRPDRVGVARDLLEHASLTTTNEHYNKARSIEASRHYAGVLEQLRPPKKRPNRRLKNTQ
jgi:integrase